MSKKAIIIFTVLLLTVLVTSCTTFMGKIGADQPNEIKPEILKFIHSLGFNNDEIFYMDRHYLDNYITNIESENNLDTSWIMRGIAQIVYFDKTGHQVSYNSMNMAGLRFPYFLTYKAKWNKTGMYDSFPPTSFYNSPLILEQEKQQNKPDYKNPSGCKFIPDVELNKDSIQSYMRPFYPQSTTEAIETENYDYTVFIIAPTMMLQKATKYQVKTVKKNIALDTSNSKIKLYFIMAETMSCTDAIMDSLQLR